MITLNNKFIYNPSEIISISEVEKFREVPYPLPSKFYIDIQFENKHSIRFGYETLNDAIKDKEFIVKMSSM